MDHTSNRTPIDLDSNGEEITFEGWELLDRSFYDLWLSPCRTYLVEHYPHGNRETDRLMKTAHNQACVIHDAKLRNINRMGQIIGVKNWEYMLVHEFTGCYWYGREGFPNDFPELLKDLHRAEVAWPTITPKNLYRNPEGELRCIAPALAQEYQSQPTNLNFWGQFLNTEETREANSLPRKYDNYVDFREWMEIKFGPALL